jgi:ADP-heptose:LPS heptosyltransferase
MRILFCKVFGIGNAAMSIPALRALEQVAGRGNVDVLVGSTSDDAGAREVFQQFVLSGEFGGRIYTDFAQDPGKPVSTYDIAVLSIPYDGRWQNGAHFRALRVMDGRTRPDPTTTGLVSWKKHEVEYQMENPIALGYVGPIPSAAFMPCRGPKVDYLKRVYVGVGYKKDAAGFWNAKHWGNENYARLIEMLLDDDPDRMIFMSGNPLDMRLSMAPILRAIRNDPRGRTMAMDVVIESSFDRAASCGYYIGNDTGMMHVAASEGARVVAYFNLPNSPVKSAPWGVQRRILDGTMGPVTPEMMFRAFKEIQP